MEDFLTTQKVSLDAQPSIIPKGLMSLLDKGFRTEEGCILFANTEYFGPDSLESEEEKNDYEIFLNGVLIEYYTGYVSDKSCLTIGLQFGMQLLQLLNNSYQAPFRVIVEFDSEENFPAPYSKVSFHKIRSVIDVQFKRNLLSLFGNDAVLFIE